MGVSVLRIPVPSRMCVCVCVCGVPQEGTVARASLLLAAG